MKLIINIDSLPVEKFPKNLGFEGYEVKNIEKKRIRPTFAFLYEFLLGKPPSKTKLWMDFVFSKNSPYKFLRFSKSFKIADRNLLSRKFLMILARIVSGRGFNPYCIPTGLLGYFDRAEELIKAEKKLEESFKKKFQVNSVKIISGNLEKIEEEVMKSRSELIFVNYSKLDYVGHIYGPDSKEYTSYVRKIFSSIARILKMEKFEKVILMNDHGMYEIKRYLNPYEVLEGFKIGKELVFFINSPMLRFWFLEDVKGDLESRLEEFERKNFGKILRNEDYRKFQFPRDKKFGELIFWLYRGHHFLPDFFWGWKKIKGMHGYLEWDKQILIKIERV